MVAVNKMDRLGFDRDAFEAIVAAYRALAERLGAGAFTAIPVSALDGDNVGHGERAHALVRGADVAFVAGERARREIDALRCAEAPLRFPVQLALRGYDARGGGARGYAGRVSERLGAGRRQGAGPARRR